MLNRVTLAGYAGGPPQPAAKGQAVRFSLATQYRRKSQWHQIIVWPPLVSWAQRVVRKGARLYVEGWIGYGPGGRAWITATMLVPLSPRPGGPPPPAEAEETEPDLPDPEPGPDEPPDWG